MKTRRTARAITAVTAVATIAVAGCSADEAGDTAEPSTVMQDADGEAGRERAGDESSEDEAPVAAEQTQRQVIRSGTMTLSSDDTEATIEEVRGLAESVGGFVSDANVRRNDLGLLRGSVTIRVPAEAYEDLRTELAGLDVTVVAETSSTEDVTDQLVDIEANLRNQRRLEEQLLALLEDVRGTDTQRVLGVFNEISAVRGRIERLEANRAAIEDRVALSTLEVTVEPTEAAAAEAAQVPEENRELPWEPGVEAESAWDRTVVGLRAFANFMITLLFTVLPLAVVWLTPVALGWAAWRWWRRRHQRPQQQPPPTADDDGSSVDA